MMNKVREIKAEGIEHERNLVNSLKKRGYVAGRLQSSGVRLPDVVAGDSESIFVFEVKSTKTDKIKIYKRQIHTLNNFAYNFNANAFIAVYFVDRMVDFLFLKPSDCIEHEKMYTIDYNTACLKGQDLSEIISNELQKKLI